jgi:hypothetical protein
MLWFEVVWAASGASESSDQGVCEVSMDEPFHGGSNDSVVNNVRPQGDVLVLATRITVFQKE